MGIDRIYEESAFQEIDPGEAFDVPPMSKLAVVALIFGVFGLVAILAPNMLVVPLLAVLLGITAFLLQSAKYAGKSLGKKFAIIGCGLGTLSAVWSYAAVQQKNDYFYNAAKPHAERFLELLAAGRKYEAMELTEMEPDRQITGTNLEVYYNSLREEFAEPFREFVSAPLTARVMSSGSEAEWKVTRGYRVTRSGNAAEVVVEARNMADADSEPLYVRLQRTVNVIIGEKGKSTALWNVIDMQTADRVAQGPD